MTATLSYFAISSIAYVCAVIFKDLPMGFWLAFTVHAAWVGLVGFGTMITEWEALVLYYIATTLFAIIGYVFAKNGHHPALVNGVYLSRTFYGFGTKSKPQTDQNGIARISGKMLFFIAIMITGIVVFELNIANFPKPWPGVIGTIIIVLDYVILYFSLRDEQEIFKSAEINRRNEVFSYVFWFGLAHFLFAMVYWMGCWLGSPTWFYDEMWNFWLTLITGAVAFVIHFLITSQSERSKDLYTPVPSTNL